MKYSIVVRHYMPDWNASNCDSDFGDVKLVSESIIYMADSDVKCVAFLDSIEDGARCDSAVYVERDVKYMTIELGDPAYYDHFVYEIKEEPS